jgi:hypothetical protein
MAVKVETEISWFVTPCSSVGGYQYFGGACCLHPRPTSNPLYLTLLASILKMGVAHPSEKLVSTYKKPTAITQETTWNCRTVVSYKEM